MILKIDYNSIPENIIGIVGNSKTLYGKNYFIETIDRYRFKVSYDAFFQVNNYGLKDDIRDIVQQYSWC